MNTELSDELTLQIKKKVSALLEKPYAGSKAFKFDHSDAKYVSDCHGTMAYVFGLDDPLVTEKTHPCIIGGRDMDKLIERYFTPLDVPKVGCLVAFYDIAGDEESLIHTALQIDYGDEIFGQSGKGGLFEPNTIEAILRTFAAVCEEVKVRFYNIISSAKHNL